MKMIPVKQHINKPVVAASAVVLGIFLSFITVPAIMYAASVSVSPGFVQVSFTNSASQQDASFAISNKSTTISQFEVAVVDVDQLSTTLKPLTTATSQAARAVTVKNPKLDVEPNKSANVLLTIDGTKLSAGGQYAAVLVKQITTSNPSNVPLQQAVAVTLFLIREEGAMRRLSFSGHLPNGLVFSRPHIAAITFSNTGNTPVTPRSVVTVERAGKVVAKSLSSSTQEQLLPGKSEPAKLSDVFTQKFVMGKYSYNVQYRYDGQTVPNVVKSTFYYVPLWFAVITGVGFLSLVLFLWVQRKRFRLLFDSSVIRHVMQPANTTKHDAPYKGALKSVVKKTKKSLQKHTKK